jgi:hypothetical protein
LLSHHDAQAAVPRSRWAASRQGPKLCTSSALYKPLTVSASALDRCVNYTRTSW